MRPFKPVAKSFSNRADAKEWADRHERTLHDQRKRSEAPNEHRTSGCPPKSSSEVFNESIKEVFTQGTIPLAAREIEFESQKAETRGPQSPNVLPILSARKRRSSARQESVDDRTGRIRRTLEVFRDQPNFKVADLARIARASIAEVQTELARSA